MYKRVATVWIFSILKWQGFCIKELINIFCLTNYLTFLNCSENIWIYLDNFLSFGKIPNKFGTFSKPLEKIPNRFRTFYEPLEKILNRFRTFSKPFEKIPNRFRTFSEPLEKILNRFTSRSEPLEKIPNRFRAFSEPLKTILNGFGNYSVRLPAAPPLAPNLRRGFFSFFIQ